MQAEGIAYARLQSLTPPYNPLHPLTLPYTPHLALQAEGIPNPNPNPNRRRASLCVARCSTG